MDVLTSETCWALNNEIKKQVISSWSLFIQLFFLELASVLPLRLPSSMFPCSTAPSIQNSSNNNLITLNILHIPQLSLAIIQARSKYCSCSPSKHTKGRAIPVQAWTGPAGSRRLRLPDFKTIVTWRWSGCQPCAPAAFTPQGNIPGTHFC